MVRLQRLAFSSASIAFVAIGALHLITHLIVLDAPGLMGNIDAVGTIDIFGTPSRVSDLWLATSILMGGFSAAFGLSNLAILAAIPARPPRLVCLVNIAMLSIIFVMGLLYLGPIQMIGGPIGIAFFAFAGLTLAPKQ